MARGRPKKESRVLNINLAQDVWNDLEKFCDETGIEKTKAVERMLRKCLDEYFSKDEKDRKPI